MAFYATPLSLRKCFNLVILSSCRLGPVVPANHDRAMMCETTDLVFIDSRLGIVIEICLVKIVIEHTFLITGRDSSSGHGMNWESGY